MTKARKIFLIIGLLIGLGIMAYPFITTTIENRKQTSIAMNVSTIVQDTDAEKLNEIMDQCIEYNSALSGIPSIFNEDGSLKTVSEDEYTELLDFGNGAMGTLEIPALDIEIPIYHGTTNETISKGAGHLYGSSLPVGGSSTHAILVSHSGLSTATLFTHLNDLEAGDTVYVHILNEVHAYVVTDKDIVQPEQVDSLGIEEDKDILTLVTCYPVTVNTHRLLVNCERDKTQDKTEENLSGNTAVLSTSDRNDADIWNVVNKDDRDYNAERKANKAAIMIAISTGVFFAIVLLVLALEKRKRKQ